MVHHSFSEQIEVKVSAKRIYRALIEDAHNFLPKSAPDRIAAVEYDNYDKVKGLEAGTVRTIKFQEGVHKIGHVKEKVEQVDHEKLHVKFSLIEGRFGPAFSDVKIDLDFKDGVHPGTAVVKCTIEYEATGEAQEIPEEEKKAGVGSFKAAEAYLLEHDDYQ